VKPEKQEKTEKKEEMGKQERIDQPFHIKFEAALKALQLVV